MLLRLSESLLKGVEKCGEGKEEEESYGSLANCVLSICGSCTLGYLSAQKPPAARGSQTIAASGC